MRNLKRFFSLFMVMMIVTVMSVGCEKTKVVEPRKASEEKQKRSAEDQKRVEEILREGEESDGVKSGEDELTEEDIKDLKITIRDIVISDYLNPNNISPESFKWPTEEWVWEYFYLISEIETAKYAPDVDSSDFDITYFTDTIPSDQMYLKDLMDTAFKGVQSWLGKQGEFDGDYYYNNVIGIMQPFEEFFNTIEF